MRQEVLRADDLIVQYPGHVALNDVSLKIGESEVVAILGANGSGKSTFVRACLGLTPFESGKVQLFGTDLHEFDEWNRVGYVPQRIHDTAGIPATVWEVVESGRLSHGWLRRYNSNDREKIKHAIEVVGLKESCSYSINTLSGGQYQRVLIARALAGEPDLLFLDEPTAGVDLATQQIFTEALKHLVEGGTTVVLVSHDLGPLRTLISRAVMFREGHMEYDGSPEAEVIDRHIFHDHPHGDFPKQGEWLI